MSAIDLEAVEKELRTEGFAVRGGTLGDVFSAALGQRRWTSAPQRGGATVTELRPATQAEAPARTLSAVHGLGPQPLHTDGAHLKRMPDVVVLHASEPTETSTSVWKLGWNHPSALSSGVFTVHGNAGSFLAHAYADGRLRFDPVCMTPADHLAKEAASFFNDARDKAHVHRWDESDTLLFIDNRRALHARDAVTSEPDAESRRLTRAAYYLESR